MEGTVGANPAFEQNGDYIIAFMIAGSVALTERWIKNGFDLSCDEMAALMLRLAQSLWEHSKDSP